MTSPEYKQSVVEAATLATAHLRHAKQSLQHIHSREMALVQTKLDEALHWLYATLRVEIEEKSIIYQSGDPDLADLDFLTGLTLPKGPTNAPPRDKLDQV